MKASLRSYFHPALLKVLSSRSIQMNAGLPAEIAPFHGAQTVLASPYLNTALAKNLWLMCR